MIDNAPKDVSTEDDFRELLPPVLWRVLARNGIQNFVQAKASYPEQLLLMPLIGSTRFRMIEQALFLGRFYFPITGEQDTKYAAKGTVLRRAQGALRRHDLMVAERYKHS